MSAKACRDRSRGESNLTVSTIGKIVEGLKVPFEQLIYNRKEIMVVPSPEEARYARQKEGGNTGSM